LSLPLDPAYKVISCFQAFAFKWSLYRYAADLICLDYELELGTDLEELRHKWRITPAP
jgi:hypothetical protein